MSAETLRRAAALMRARAQAAPAGPWYPFEVPSMCREPGPGDWIVDSDPRLIAGNIGTTDDPTAKPRAEHIASWHPDVALVIAEWLDATERTVPPDPHTHGYRCETCSNVYNALAVANAYLGES